jgi:hypothetical protein
VGIISSPCPCSVCGGEARAGFWSSGGPGMLSAGESWPAGFQEDEGLPWTPPLAQLLSL